MKQVLGITEISSEFWSVSLKRRNDLEDKEADERIILKWILRKYSRRVQTALIWRVLTNKVMFVKTDVFWDVRTRVVRMSEVLTASIIRTPLKRRSVSIRLQGATSLTIFTFILIAARA
jgi:hypothetical protein